jgi:hypothetical protein
MASTLLTGFSIPAHDGLALTGSIAFSSNVIDATGEKVAFVGPVWFQARTGTKDIRKVGFRFGSVTKSGGSALTVSLQNVSTSAGPPARPDESQDQTVAVANANGSFLSNTWIQTGNLSADRTVNFGEMLAVVIEFDGSGRTAPDSVAISGVPLLGGASSNLTRSMTIAKLGGTWQIDASIAPNIILEFSDGTFGTLSGAFPCSAVGSFDYDSASSPDEYALRFQFPVPVSIDAAGAVINYDANSSDAEIVCYTGTTPMTDGTVTVDAHNTVLVGGTARPNIAAPFGAALALSGSTAYRIGVKPTTASNIQLSYYDMASAAHFQAHVGGADWYLSSRTDAGAWTDTTTRRPFIWPYICAVDDGTGGGGGSAGGAHIFGGTVIR